MEKNGDRVLPTDCLLQTSTSDNNGALARFKHIDFFSFLVNIHNMDTSHLIQDKTSVLCRLLKQIS